jgi:hypothetical protein
MKYKIAIILILGTIITTLIYYKTNDNKIYYLALGDGISSGMTSYNIESYNFNDYFVDKLNEEEKLNKYYKKFNEVDETLNSLLMKINNNIPNIDQEIKIKQAIKKANIITIAIGMDELNNYAKKNTLGTTKIKGFINKYEELLKIIRSLNNKKIYVISLYSSKLINQSKIKKINNELEIVVNKYNGYFIDISDITKNEEYFTLNSNYYLNYKGQNYIYEKIKNKLELETIKII